MASKQDLQPPKETQTSRYKRCVNRAQQKLKVDATNSLPLMDIPAADDDSTTSYSVSVCIIGTQTEMTGDFIDSMTGELQKLRTENIQLRSDVEHLSSSYDQSAIEGVGVMPAPHQNKAHNSASTSGTCQTLFPGGLKTTNLTLSLSKHQLSVSQGPPGPDERCRNEYTQMQVFPVKVEDNYDDQTAQLFSPVKEEEEQEEIFQLSTELFAVKKEEEEILIDLPQQVERGPGFVPSPTHSSSSGSTDLSDKWPNGSPAAKSSQSNSLFGKAKMSKQDVSEEDSPKGSNQDSQSEEEDSPQGSKYIPKAKLHSCATCGKRFGSIPGLRRHSVMHTGKKPHPCQKCNKRFWTPAEVKRHMMTHTGERPFPCLECHKCFTLPASLKVHQRVHTGEKPHICGVCGKGFTQPGNLRIHERRHTGERPFSCSHCGRTFIDQGHLKKHIRSHTGEKPYVCSNCPMKFISSTELKVHCRIHSKEKNYSCAFCEKKFSQPHNARIHQKIHIEGKSNIVPSA